MKLHALNWSDYAKSIVIQCFYYYHYYYLYIYIYNRNPNLNSHTRIFWRSWRSNPHPHREMWFFGKRNYHWAKCQVASMVLSDLWHMIRARLYQGYHPKSNPLFSWRLTAKDLKMNKVCSNQLNTRTLGLWVFHMAILKHMTHFVMSLKAEVGTRHKLSIYILNHAYVYFSMFIYIYIYIYIDIV